jgi:hypothetical protein
MQIKKTELAKIIRDEIANVIEEARRYGEFGDTRRSHAYRTRRATSSSERLRKDRLRAAQIKHGKEEYAAGKADFEAGKDMDEDPTRHGQYKTGYMDAKAEADGGSMKEDQIKAARFDHAHLPGNDEEGQFGKVQQLEEVGILSTMLDPAMVAGLSDAARVAVALIDNILTIGLPSAAVAGLMNMLMKNEDIPKEEREMIAAALDDKKPAGIPADELGAKR